MTARDFRIPGERAETDACDDLGFFGRPRGVRDRAVMLDLRRKDRSIAAIGYGWQERIASDPSEGITLASANT